MFTNTLTQNEDPENDLSNARNKRSKKNTQEMTTFEKQLRCGILLTILLLMKTWHSSIQFSLQLEDWTLKKKYFFRSQVLQLLVGINQDTSCTGLVQCQSTNMGPSTSIGLTTSVGPSTSAGPATSSTSEISPVSASSCSTENYDTDDSFHFDFTTL